MRLVPVLDVMNGEVVRGVGGRRPDYRPMVSRLTPSSHPLEVARAIYAHFGLNELYLADLDAILGGEPIWTLFAALREAKFRLWVDAGVREATRADRLAAAGIENIIVGLETVVGPIELATIAAALGERLVFSLDLRAGEPLGDRSAWQGGDAWSIAVQAIQGGVRRLLVLDLARVGLGGGPGTHELCRRIRIEFPEMEISAGGGVRHRGDVQELRACGVQVVLVASALHDGRLTLEGIKDEG